MHLKFQLSFFSTIVSDFGGSNDWFADQFDDLVFGDIDDLTRDDHGVNAHHEDDFDPTSLDPHFGKSHVYNPFGNWGDSGININYIPDDFSVTGDMVKKK